MVTAFRDRVTQSTCKGLHCLEDTPYGRLRRLVLGDKDVNITSYFVQ